MTREESIERAKDLANWLATEIDDREIPATLRGHLAGACFFIALDHHSGVVHLVDMRLDAPSLALMRPLMEAYLIGSWLSQCASDAEITNFTGGRFPKAETMVKLLEKTERFNTGVLADMKRNAWPALSDFSHTGIRLVTRVVSEGMIERNFPDEEIEEVLGFAGAGALLAAQGIAALGEDEEFSLRLLERMKAHASRLDNISATSAAK